MTFSIPTKDALPAMRPGVKARAAFTLSELLGLIAIIAILGVMLMPVLERARQTKLTTQCLNNMKQLQMCYRMYMEDNNDTLPPNAVVGFGNGVYSWITSVNTQTTVLLDGIRNGLLYQYDPNTTLYQCPANLRKLPTPPQEVLKARQEYGNPGIVAGSPLSQTRTCSINYPLGGYTATGSLLATGVHAVNRYSQFAAPNPGPAKMFVFCDENEYSVDDGVFAVYPAGSGQNVWWNMPGSRHNRGTTWSFADGHVEYWRWDGSTVPNAEINQNYQGFTPADTSDDLARVQACTCPLGN